MSHANTALTPRARLRLARLVVDGGWSRSQAAKMFMVSPRTAAKWADRYRVEGAAGMADHSSRPRTSPAKTPEQVKRRIVRLRWRHRLGPVQIAGQLGVRASTVHAVLVRCRINRLGNIDRVTGEPIRHYERDRPGELIHVDVTKFGNIPDGGGWRFVGKQQGDRNRAATVIRTGTQTNGKIERFHRTLTDGWAYARRYDSETARRDALPDWLHFYNHHRAHSAIGGLPPASRLTNLPGHHS